ncbi:trypsin-7-like [Arctopsyche grandis]|uniref:trypsin-7-like n=1 Tax=Arctopsyche grandis TaxID=121162 RepID=UPI00406D7DD9
MVAIKLVVIFIVLCATFLPSVYGFGRIVGGIESSIERRPYQASLQYLKADSYDHSCGASIISTKFLLSAAHCYPDESELEKMYARVGSTAFDNGGQLVKVASFSTHPNFVSLNLDYDFAIVTLRQEIILGPNVAIIPLATGSDPEDGSLVTISGWGVTTESMGEIPTNLREVDLPVVNHSTCRRSYLFLTSRQICLGGTPQGCLSACFGDSGGPAVQNGVQYALVSGGTSCEKPNVPGLYAKISSGRDWITEMTGV